MSVTEFDWPSSLGGGGPGSGGLPSLEWNFFSIPELDMPGIPSLPLDGVKELADWYADYLLDSLRFQLRVGAGVAGAVLIVLAYGLHQVGDLTLPEWPGLPTLPSSVMEENMWIGPGVVFHVR